MNSIASVDVPEMKNGYEKCGSGPNAFSGFKRKSNIAKLMLSDFITSSKKRDHTRRHDPAKLTYIRSNL